MKTEKEKQLEKERIRNRLRYSKRSEQQRAWRQRPEIKAKFNEYMRAYAKDPEVIKKRKIRRMTMYYYGKVPKGYHRHHLDYDTPHNFILIKAEEHGLKHRK